MTRKAATPDADRRRSHFGRTMAAVIAAVGLALMTAACSHSGGPSAAPPSSASAGGPRTPSAVAYSACMRSHDVPNYPDPDSSGQLPKTDAQHLGVSTSRYDTAQQACQHLLPAGGSTQDQVHQCMENSDCPPAMVQQMLAADRRLAQCMRSHGVPNFPDPITDSHGPIFNITAAGISDAASHTPPFLTALNRCGRHLGANAPESFE